MILLANSEGLVNERSGEYGTNGNNGTNGKFLRDFSVCSVYSVCSVFSKDIPAKPAEFASRIRMRALPERLCIVSKIRGGVSLTGPGLSRKMWGRKIRPRRLSAIFLPGIFLLPPIFERIRDY
jgi:hypothetical protein